MIFEKRFVSIFLAGFIFIVSTNVSASENDISIVDIINNSETYEDIVPFITDDTFNNLCVEYNTYSDGYSDNSVDYISKFLFESIPYENEKLLADIYAAACILSFENYYITYEYLENGFLIELTNCYKYNYLSSSGKRKVAQELSHETPYEFYELCDTLEKIVSDNQSSSGGSCGSGSSSGSSGSNSGSGGGSGAKIPVSSVRSFNTDGSVPNKITDNTIYTVKYTDISSDYDKSIILFAVYDKNGRLKTLRNQEYSCTESEYNENLILDSTDTVKIIRLDSFENIMPLYAPKIIDLSEYEDKVIIYEGILTEASETQLCLNCSKITQNGITTDFYDTVFLCGYEKPVYKYVGCNVRIALYDSNVYNFELLEERDFAVLNCKDIANFSMSEISTLEENYSISPDAYFFLDSFSDNNITDSILEDIAQCEVVLSKPKDSIQWNSVNFITFCSYVVEYTDAENGSIYIDNGIINTNKSSEFIYNNQPASFADIKPGCIISVGLNTIIINDKTVNGKAELSDSFVTIDEESFMFDPYIDFDNYYENYTAYIDAFGYAVKLVPDKSILKDIFITAANENNNGTTIKYNDMTGTEYSALITEDTIIVADNLLYSELILNEILAANGYVFAQISPKDDTIGYLYLYTKDKDTKFTNKNEFNLLACPDAVITNDTKFVIYNSDNDKYSYCGCREVMKTFSANETVNARIYFCDDDLLHAAYIYVPITSSMLTKNGILYTTAVDYENNTVSGFINGEAVTFTVSPDIMIDIDAFCAYKVGYIENELTYSEYKTDLSLIGYYGVSSNGISFAKGYVRDLEDGYMVISDNDYSSVSFSTAALSKSVNVYIYNHIHGTFIKSNLSEIIADPNGIGFGSFVSCMYTVNGAATDIVIYK